MSICSFGLYGSNYIYSSRGKGSRRGHDIQRMWRSIDIVRERLTLVAFPYMDAKITFHGEPVITCPQDLPGHSMPVGVCSKRALMDFLDHVICLLGIHTSQECHVVISLIQCASAHEETGCQPPQCPFIVVGNLCRVFFAFDISLDVVIPGLSVPFLFHLATMCGFATTLKFNVG